MCVKKNVELGNIGPWEYWHAPFFLTFPILPSQHFGNQVSSLILLSTYLPSVINNHLMYSCRLKSEATLEPRLLNKCFTFDVTSVQMTQEWFICDVELGHVNTWHHSISNNFICEACTKAVCKPTSGSVSWTVLHLNDYIPNLSLTSTPVLQSNHSHLFVPSTKAGNVLFLILMFRNRHGRQISEASLRRELTEASWRLRPSAWNAMSALRIPLW